MFAYSFVSLCVGCVRVSYGWTTLFLCHFESFVAHPRSILTSALSSLLLSETKAGGHFTKGWDPIWFEWSQPRPSLSQSMRRRVNICWARISFLNQKGLLHPGSRFLLIVVIIRSSVICSADVVLFVSLRFQLREYTPHQWRLQWDRKPISVLQFYYYKIFGKLIDF